MLAGFYALLFVPFLGKLVQHVLVHWMIHLVESHEWFALLFWLPLLGVPVLAVLRDWWGVADAVLVLMIVRRAFTAHSA